MAGLKKGDEVISLNGVLADSPGSVPSSMDLALMTGQLEMIIYRVDAQNEQSAEEEERKTNFKMKLARFCTGDLGTGPSTPDAEGDKSVASADEIIIEPKLVERRKSQLFIQALQLEQDEEERIPSEQTNKESHKQAPIDVPVEEQLIMKRKNSLSKSLAAASSVEKKSPVEEIAPQTIEKKKAEFIRQASSDNIVKSIDVKAEINVEQHLVLQRKASIEKAAQRYDETKTVDLPTIAVAQIKASIANNHGPLVGECRTNKLKPGDIETTLEERKASFFEHSGSRVERTTVDLNIEPKLIEQRKANFLENAESIQQQKIERFNLDLDIQPRLIEQRKANFLENATRKDKPHHDIDIEAKIVEKKLIALQVAAECAPVASDHRKVELTVNSMQSKPKIEVPIEPDLIRKRKEALFCSSTATNDIERRRAKLANIEAEVYGTSQPEQQSSITITLPSDHKRFEDESHTSTTVYPVLSPTDRSESTVSEDSRTASCVTTVTEIKRDVDVTMVSSVASSSLISPISERNESPAHLSDLSPDSDLVTAMSSSTIFTTDLSPDVDDARFDGRQADLPEMPDTVLLLSQKKCSQTDGQSSSVNEGSNGHQTIVEMVSPVNPEHRTKDAGHTPWHGDKPHGRLVLQNSTIADRNPKVVHMRHHPNYSGYPQESSSVGVEQIPPNDYQTVTVYYCYINYFNLLKVYDNIYGKRRKLSFIIFVIILLRQS